MGLHSTFLVAEVKWRQMTALVELGCVLLILCTMPKVYVVNIFVTCDTHIL